MNSPYAVINPEWREVSIDEGPREEVKPDAELTNDEKASQVPDPTGWKILCAVPELSKKFDGTSIERAESSIAQEQHATVVLFVMKLGPDCYRDMAKYPTGPWCKQGDFVLVRAYSGTRFKIHGREFRVIYEDQVEAVVSDPRGVGRV